MYRYAGLLGFVEILRMAVIHYAAIMWTKSWVHMQTFLRANLLKAQMQRAGATAGGPPRALPTSARRRDVLLIDASSTFGGLVFSVAAGSSWDASPARVLLSDIVSRARPSLPPIAPPPLSRAPSPPPPPSLAPRTPRAGSRLPPPALAVETDAVSEEAAVDGLDAAVRGPDPPSRGSDVL